MGSSPHLVNPVKLSQLALAYSCSATTSIACIGSGFMHLTLQVPG